MKYSKSNKPLSCIFTQSRCYTNSYNIKPVGVLWHSTGANNSSLKRYVQPSSNDPNREKLMEMLGKNTYANDWNRPGLSVGVNAFIGKLADGSVTTVQTLPWEMRPWGCASGRNGSCNNGWIQFEICEDGLNNKAYFEAVYKEACELTAYLCKEYGLDPYGTVTMNGVKVPVILCHADSYKLGLGSNHGDVLHWFPKYGKTMDDVRKDVAALMGASKPATSSPAPAEPATPTRPVLRQGSTGQYVEQLQDRLNELGYDCGSVDGKFGSITLTQVLKFQKDRKLSQDGAVGPATWAELDKKVIPPAFEPYKVKVSANTLNYRSGPGAQYKVNGKIKKNQVYTIIEENNGWGKLKSGAGWISLDYVKKI